MIMIKIHSRLTYLSIGLTTVGSLVALFIINKTDRQDLPLDGLIALNIFLFSVIIIVFIMIIKLKRVYILKNTIIVKPLFSRKEIQIPFNCVIELKNILPMYLDPLNTKLIYNQENEIKVVYFIKSIKFVATSNLGMKLGIIKDI